MPKKTYTLLRGGEPITITKEEEFFTAIIPDRKAAIELVSHSEVKQMKKVFNNVYKIKTTKGTQSNLMEKIRSNEMTNTIAHHAYSPVGDTTTRYYITDKIIINFKKKTSRSKINAIFEKHSLQFLKEYAESQMSYLVQVTKSSGMNPVKLTNILMKYPEVVAAEPNLINRFMNFYTPKDGHFKKQWHLHSKDDIQLVAHASVDATKAWDITKGSRKVVVAVIDDGFDIEHRDLKADGKKIVYPRDFVDGDLDPSPTKAHDDYHGTPCAGVAIGEENDYGIVGVAPNCAFMPIRFDLAADDDLLWEIFNYTGKHADVISCSWGPVPVYAPLSKLLKDKFTELTLKGGPRKKGCVICFAAGNYNAPLHDSNNRDFRWFHPGYNQIFKTPGPIINGNCVHPDVIAVSASTSLGKKAAYSNWGKEISMVAPSNNWHPLDTQKFVPGRGIWTTDNENVGTGFTANNKYTGDFGGTSSATPLLAGIAALVISVDPSLTAKEVRKIMESTADKIEDKDADIVLGHKKGTYKKGHSEWFGYGKVNAAKAVAKAKALKEAKEKVEVTSNPESMSPKATTEGIYILSAMVNPKGTEKGNETITLLNATNQSVNFKNWKLTDGKRKKEELKFTLKAGAIKTINLSTKFTLANSGGNVLLLNPEKVIVHQVKYTKKDASKEGWTIKF
ncbi:MAG: S8 family serine peptidase [Saprospiraceae bacterium]